MASIVRLQLLLIMLPQIALMVTYTPLTEEQKVKMIGQRNMDTSCINGQKFRDFQPGVLGVEYYNFLKNKQDEVIKLMEAHREEQERKWPEGMSSAWFIITISSIPLIFILIGAIGILYGTIKHTDHSLMLDKYYKDK